LGGDAGADKGDPKNSVTFGEHIEIRTRMSKMMLELMVDEDRDAYAAIVLGNRCRWCPTKFRMFNRAKSCDMCAVKACSECVMVLDMRGMLGEKAGGKATLCKECKLYLGGRASM
jgi:hypothetical protein